MSRMRLLGYGNLWRSTVKWLIICIKVERLLSISQRMSMKTSYRQSTSFVVVTLAKCVIPLRLESINLNSSEGRVELTQYHEVLAATRDNNSLGVRVVHGAYSFECERTYA